jgi:hypothetical protein
MKAVTRVAVIGRIGRRIYDRHLEVMGQAERVAQTFACLCVRPPGKWRLEADFPIGLMRVRIIMGAIGTGSAHSLTTTTTTTTKNSWQ